MSPSISQFYILYFIYIMQIYVNCIIAIIFVNIVRKIYSIIFNYIKNLCIHHGYLNKNININVRERNI